MNLGICVTAPFEVRRDSDTPVRFLALVHDFGAPRGTLVCRGDEWEKYRRFAASEGYFLSGLYLEAYSRYERERFVETLDDWGWFGQGAPPPWYRGGVSSPHDRDPAV